MKLRACLDQCSLGLLRQIAAAHQVVVAEPPARAELSGEIARRLAEPGYLATMLAGLGPLERAALQIVAEDGGEILSFLLERRLRQAPGLDDAAGLAPEALRELSRLGLLYRLFQAVGPERGELYALPDELLPLLPTRQRQQELPSPREADEPSERRRCSSAFTLFAMASFIRRWRQREARAGRANGQLAELGEETAALTAELPGRTPRERWTLLAHLGLREELFIRVEGGLQPTEQLEEWLRAGPAAERRLWRSYVEAEQWNDLERAGSGAHRFGGRMAEPLETRATLLGAFREVLSERWVLAADVEGLVRDRAPDFLREGFDRSTAGLVDLSSGELLGGADSWERVEAPLIWYLLSGPLFWLGVVEWGGDGGSWDRVRLTEAGRSWLEDVDEALAPARDPFELTEERRLIAPLGCDLALLWQLEPYLALETRGPPSVYLLSRSAFARGLEAGGSPGELRRLLERAAGGALPLAFSLALERWGVRAGRFKLRPMVVLTAADPAELETVLERAEGSALVRERLGPAAVAVAPARAMDLAEQLERLGQLPEVDAALRLMAGRRAYAAQVDQTTLEALLFCLRLLRALDQSLVGEVPQADRLILRLEQALGPVAAPKIVRRARAAARRLRGRPAAGRVERSIVPPGS